MRRSVAGRPRPKRICLPASSLFRVTGQGTSMPVAGQSLAMLSMHTSPLALAGQGDAGGMNVYVRELVSALAQAGEIGRAHV